VRTGSQQVDCGSAPGDSLIFVAASIAARAIGRATWELAALGCEGF
jgi:hypothetical protein